MIPALFVLALAAQTPAPLPSAAAPAAAVVPARLKVLVLDVQSADLTANERTTLTNLAAAQLSEDTRLEVLSGEDIKQLVKLQGQAQDIGVEGNCTDACMAELAGALGAGVVVAIQAGKLGETLVLSLVVFDAAKAKTVSRKSVQATSLGELPSKLGPALTALVQPLLPAVAVVRETPASTAPMRAAAVAEREMSPRLRELYDVEAMQVCVNPEERAVWWFCNQKQTFTENQFVREYRALTGRGDLDRAEFDRGDSIVPPLALYSVGALGVAGFGTMLACGLIQACGEDAARAFSLNEIDGVPLGPITMGVSMAALVGGLTGGIIVSSEMKGPDGTLYMHVLTESEARGGIARYNAALRDRLARDLGE